MNLQQNHRAISSGQHYRFEKAGTHVVHIRLAVVHCIAMCRADGRTDVLPVFLNPQCNPLNSLAVFCCAQWGEETPMRICTRSKWTSNKTTEPYQAVNTVVSKKQGAPSIRLQLTEWIGDAGEQNLFRCSWIKSGLTNIGTDKIRTKVQT